MEREKEMNWIGILLIIAAVWLLVSSANINLHTGGDETLTSNRTRASAWTLIGDASVTVGQGGGETLREEEKKTKDIICPFCKGVIVVYDE